MTRAAKLVWNTNNWERPDGNAGLNGVPVIFPNGNYSYGLEEFLFSQDLSTRNFGYLDCYRRVDRNYLNPENIVLFSLNPDGDLMHIGNLHNAIQLQNVDRVPIWNEMNENNYLENVVVPAFNDIEGLVLPDQSFGYERFIHHNFGAEINNLPNIQAAAPNGFFVNLIYEHLQRFEVPVNLTEIEPTINDSWHYLSQRYIVENLQNPDLVENLQNSFL